MKANDENDPLDTSHVLRGYPRPEELAVEDLPTEWLEEDRVIEGSKPDLGEIEEDSSEI